MADKFKKSKKTKEYKEDKEELVIHETSPKSKQEGLNRRKNYYKNLGIAQKGSREEAKFNPAYRSTFSPGDNSATNQDLKKGIQI